MYACVRYVWERLVVPEGAGYWPAVPEWDNVPPVLYLADPIAGRNTIDQVAAGADLDPITVEM